MTDLVTPTQDAVFAALSAGVPAELGGAHQHVRQNTQPPLNIITDIDVEAGDDRDGLPERMTVTIVSIYAGEDRRQLLAQLAAVRGALHGATLKSDVADLGAPTFLSASVSGVADDGRTYAAVSLFEIFAEPR